MEGRVTMSNLVFLCVKVVKSKNVALYLFQIWWIYFKC